tara:strand:+ start:4130 stop:6490 length:2361 start_codon:yes stop_codon:yes gene_type:complete
MKKSLLLIFVFMQIISYNIYAQDISADLFQNQIIKEDFNQQAETFKIITTSDNYFILDNGDYFLSRNNSNSEFAIFANNSEVSDFLLKTAIRIGPSPNNEASIGLILKAQKNANGAIIFEINKQKEFRIKQLIKNKYQILSGNSKNSGWEKTKLLNGIDEINYIEIRSNSNVYDVYINNEYLSTFFVPEYAFGSCGLIISPKTKARVSYFYLYSKGLNTDTLNFLEEISSTEDLSKKIKILEENNLQLIEFNNNIQEKLNNEIIQLNTRNLNLENSLKDKNQEILSLKNEIGEIKSKIESTIQIENEEIIKLQNKNKSLQESIIQKENLIDKFKNKINDIEEKITDLSILNTEIEKIKLFNAELQSNIKEKDFSIQKLNENISEINRNNEYFISNIDSLNATIYYLNDSLVNKKEEINIIKKKLEIKNSEYISTNAKIQDLSKETTSLNTKILEYQTQILNINLAFDNEKLKIDSLNNILVSNLNNEINQLNLIITNEKDLKNDLKNSFIEDISDKENQILELNNINSILTKESEKNKIDLEKLKEEKSFLNASINNLTKDLKKSENSLKKLQNESNNNIKNLEEKNNNISQLNINANQNIKKIKEENEQYKNTIQNQILKIEKISSQINNLNDEINSLKEIQAQKSSSNLALEKLNISFLDSIKNLNNTNKELETKIRELKNLFVEKNFEVNGINTNKVIETKDNKYLKEEINTKIFYTVKLGVYMKIQQNNQININNKIWYEETDDGNYIYYSGEFQNPIDAQNHLNNIKKLGYKNSYVIIKEE